MPHAADDVVAAAPDGPDGFVLLVRQAARAAALGDPSLLPAWWEAGRALGNRAAAALLAEASRGAIALRHADGPALADAVLAAQDFACLLRATREATILPAAVVAALEEWVDEASQAEVDADAADLVRAYAEQYPLPDAVLLPAVRMPMTAFDSDLLTGVRMPRQELRTRWRDGADARLRALMLAGGEWPDALRERFERDRLETPVDAGPAGTVRVSCRLGGGKTVLVDLESDDRAFAGVDLVRLGVYAGQRVPPHETLPSDAPWCGQWEIGLGHLPADEQLTTLRQALVIRLHDGPSVRIDP